MEGGREGTGGCAEGEGAAAAGRGRATRTNCKGDGARHGVGRECFRHQTGVLLAFAGAGWEAWVRGRCIIRRPRVAEAWAHELRVGERGGRAARCA